MPPGSAPPSGVAGLSLLNLPSMLQSCGKFKVRQSASLNAGASAPGTSPRWKCQPISKSARVRGDWAKLLEQKITRDRNRNILTVLWMENIAVYLGNKCIIDTK